MKRVVLAIQLMMLTLLWPQSARAFERTLLREEATPEGLVVGTLPCLLSPNTNGTCANYRWYNVCSGYIWIYGLGNGESVGVLFGGPEQPCVAGNNTVKRVITYYRNVLYSYDQERWDVYLDRDNQGDGCPDGVLASTPVWDYNIGLRWNCWEVGQILPANISHVIVRHVRRTSTVTSRLATDGPYSLSCDPVGTPRSFYYGINGAECRTWVGPTGRYDNFLAWLIIDGEVPNAAAPTSWGKIKALFQ